MKPCNWISREPGRLWIVFMSALLMTQAVRGTVIPADRVYPWQGNVGIPGGIPVVTVIHTNLPASGLTALIVNAALRSCPSNQVVMLPPGTFVFDGMIDWQSVNHGVVLRGTTRSGTNATKIISRALIPIYMRRFWSGSAMGTAVNVAQDTVQGNRQIILTTVPSWIKIGQLYGIDMLNDEVLASVNTCREGADIARNHFASAGQRGMGQTFRVTAFTNNTLTIECPLTWSFKTNLSAQVWKFAYDPETATPRILCGIEDLEIEGAARLGSVSHMIFLENCDRCWVKNVRSHLVPCNTHIYISYSYRCEVRHCWVDDGFSDGAGQDYGIALYYNSCNCLIEDNIASRCHEGFEVGQGCAGNVIAYNFQSEGHASSDEIDMIIGHNCHGMMNLFEGNVGYGKIMFDCIHGSSSHETVFRNRVYGWQSTEKHNNCAIDVDYFNRFCNVVGNVCGYEGFHTVASIQAPAWSFFDKIVYKWGYVNAYGLQTSCYDPASVMKLIFHGNYDTVSKTVLWDPSVADHTLPASYYLSSKPSWFGKLAWPPVDPFTPRTYVGFETNIPAGHRFVYRVDPPKSPVNLAPVAVATASPLVAQPLVSIAFSSIGSFDPEGVVLSYHWEFGDGGISTAANPSHAYSQVGTYDARLPVSDGLNTSSARSLLIKVELAGGNQPSVDNSVPRP
jgi:hypothetical protein